MLYRKFLLLIFFFFSIALVNAQNYFDDVATGRLWVSSNVTKEIKIKQ